MATQSRQQTAGMSTGSGEAKPDPRPQGIDPRFDSIRVLLDREPYTVHFFQAVRLLERLYPDRNPVGLFVSPSSEVVQFSSVPTLAFPASEIHDLKPGTNGQPRLFVNFMGLSAAVGALPHTYTEFLLERIRAKDRGPGEFFGTRQSGLPALRIANILRDPDILSTARQEARAFVERPPSEEVFARAVEHIKGHWQRRYGLVQVG